MGNFNPNSPSYLGSEWRPQTSRNIVLTSLGNAVAQQVVPGAVTPADIDLYLSSFAGTPGIAIELVSTLAPTLDAPVTVYPGTDTGGSFANWNNESAAAASYVKVNKQTVGTTYLTNNSAALSELSFRGTTAISAAKRVISIAMNVQIAYPQTAVPGQTFFFQFVSASTSWAPVTPIVNIGSTAYSMGAAVPSPNPNYAIFSSPAKMLNPATGVPWKLTADAQTLCNGIDRFGVQKSKSAFTGEHRIQGMWLTVQTCAENRLACYYSATAMTAGWQRYILIHPDTGAISALSANTNYWIVIYLLNSTGGASITIPALSDSGTILATSASATGIHVVTSDAVITNGIVTGSTQHTGEMIPALFENPAGTFNAESKPYVALTNVNVTTGPSQQVTATAGTTYGGVRFPLGWVSAVLPPTAKLTAEIRHGAGAATGGGTLDATATVPAAYLANGALQDVTIPFDASFVSGNTQYYVFFRSTSTTNLWCVGQLDSGSNSVTTITAANVEGTGIGGTTDSYVDTTGAAITRYDIPVLLTPATVKPTNVTATVVGAI